MAAADDRTLAVSEVAPTRPPNHAGAVWYARAVTQYPTDGPETVGTELDVFASMVTVCPDSPLAAASMQALSKLLAAEVGAVDGQAVGVVEHQTPLVPHVKLLGELCTAARTAASAALSAVACAVSRRKYPQPTSTASARDPKIRPVPSVAMSNACPRLL
jgi:hypothetical protein